MQSGAMFRRFYSQITLCSSNLNNNSLKKKQIVFMGSPQVAAIVTQPPSRRDRGRKVLPSPVAEHALESGFAPDLIFTPEKAGEENFLSNLSALHPEICITAAYGNILPSKFLKIPTLGSELLIRELPSIFDGSAKVKACDQDESKATLAPKLTPEESWLSFDQVAIVLHNKVRAFAGWPGTRAKVRVLDSDNGEESILELKIITTRVGNTSNVESDDVSFVGGALVIPCGGNSTLEVIRRIPYGSITRFVFF
ncbi:methionyl-tRNA formyltransferase [Ranunculus cassubicifolius]